MKTLIIYYVILSVYISLLSCQLVACHLTHSLIILTDSYINLYKILDISLGIIHLRTQQELIKKRTTGENSNGKTRGDTGGDNVNGDHKKLYPTTLAGRIFGCRCTYQFKRLPLLGSFINGLFLAALLMSAAIEGIQTCFHSSHSIGHDKKSILTENPLTYPLILVGFALVDLIMQHCSLKAHEMREEELMSESLLDLSHNNKDGNNNNSATITTRSTHLQQAPPVTVIKELSAASLAANQAGSIELVENGRHRLSASNGASISIGGGGKRRSYDLNVLHRDSTTANSRLVSSNNGANSSLQELPTSLSDFNDTRISLKSLKFSTNLDSIVPTADAAAPTIGSISKDLEAPRGTGCGGGGSKSKQGQDKCWFVIRYVTAPLALITCASVVYFVNNELATEISDATLSVVVVTLMFAASYPPMKKAGKVLLQSAPEGVDLDKLEKDLLATSPLVMEVKNLHVWSLTPRSNRVATCQLVLDKAQVSEDKRVIEQIMSEARFKFLDQNIKCTTVEPILGDKDGTGKQ